MYAREPERAPWGSARADEPSERNCRARRSHRRTSRPSTCSAPGAGILAAKQRTQQVQGKIRARIVEVRRDLAAKRAAQAAASGSSLKLWKGYLAALGGYGVSPPTAASCATRSTCRRACCPLRDAAGVAQPGVATVADVTRRRPGAAPVRSSKRSGSPMRSSASPTSRGQRTGRTASTATGLTLAPTGGRDHRDAAHRRRAVRWTTRCPPVGSARRPGVLQRQRTAR